MNSIIKNKDADYDGVHATWEGVESSTGFETQCGLVGEDVKFGDEG